MQLCCPSCPKTCVCTQPKRTFPQPLQVYDAVKAELMLRGAYFLKDEEEKDKACHCWLLALPAAWDWPQPVICCGASLGLPSREAMGLLRWGTAQTDATLLAICLPAKLLHPLVKPPPPRYATRSS